MHVEWANKETTGATNQSDQMDDSGPSDMIHVCPNFQTSMLIVDDALTDTELTADMYMSKKVPSELPYNNKNFRLV